VLKVLHHNVWKLNKRAQRPWVAHLNSERSKVTAEPFTEDHPGIILVEFDQVPISSSRQDVI